MAKENALGLMVDLKPANFRMECFKGRDADRGPTEAKNLVSSIVEC